MFRGNGRNGFARIAAFVATLAFVLQAALAVAVTPVQRDIFGNVICAEGSTGHSPSGQGHDGGHLPDCCLVSCATAFQTANGLPATFEWRMPLVMAETVADRPGTPPLLQTRRTPANPRAPPTA